METLKVWRVHPSVTLPKHQTTQSACFDISFQSAGKRTYKGYSNFNKPFERQLNGQILLNPGDRVMVPTGLILDIPEGYSVRIHARSGLSLKQGLVLANAEGVIDSDYVEELFVLLTNMTDNAQTINSGDRIAQGELVKNVEYAIVESVLRPVQKTNRVGGMGSTGVSVVGGTIVLNIGENTVETPIENEKTVVPVKRGRGRPRKNGASS